MIVEHCRLGHNDRTSREFMLYLWDHSLSFSVFIYDDGDLFIVTGSTYEIRLVVEKYDELIFG